MAEQNVYKCCLQYLPGERVFMAIDTSTEQAWTYDVPPETTTTSPPVHNKYSLYNTWYSLAPLALVHTGPQTMLLYRS